MEMLPDSQQYRDALARCEKATAGPWVEDAEEDLIIAGDLMDGEAPVIPRNYDDMEFICHARTDLPAALRTIAALQARVEGLEKLVHLYPDFEQDTDVTGCPTGWLDCIICGGGGHSDARKKRPIQHKPDCPREMFNKSIIQPSSNPSGAKGG